MAEGESPVPAVYLRGVRKSYGRGSKKVNVLKGIDMTVPIGAIYGLLGPSGCGKTTLLRSVLGRLAIDSGQLIVLGDQPGAPGHGVPGSRVGYMPQEISLFEVLTIGETFSYFGRIHGMSRSAIASRTKVLLDFLTLPDKGRRTGQLSGGQMRRVSLAVALLQEPDLLILDEPTVGVDPVLREKIWEHLLEIAQNHQQTTVIITTHYIEEAGQADKVGMMRNGRLLGEEAPSALMQKFNMNSLESVFLHLCHADNTVGDGDSLMPVAVNAVSNNAKYDHAKRKTADEKTPLLSNTHGGYEEVKFQDNEVILSPGVKFEEPVQHQMCPGSHCLSVAGFHSIIALLIKNIIVLRRNIPYLVFQFILPTIQIVLFQVCIGGDPYSLPVGIVNNDTGDLGNLFIKFLNNDTIDKINYANLNEALDSVRDADTWGAISIGQNFSADIVQRFVQGVQASASVLEGSTIKIFLDMTNQEISINLQEKISNAFQTFGETVLTTFGINPNVSRLPVQVQAPIYGEANPSFTNFVAPGIILSITFFMATGLTSIMFVLEKKEGLLDRSYVSGVVPVEVMLSHILTQFLVLVVQVTLLLVFAFFIFDVPYEGPMIWVILLTLFEGFTGMSLGMLISAICDRESTALQLTVGCLFPLLLTSGILWPIEGMPVWMRSIVQALPLTLGTQAMRSLLSRGWDITFLYVWRGYLVTIAWGTGLLILSGIIVRIRK